MSYDKTGLYTTAVHEEDKQQARFDPLNPTVIRQKAEEIDEFEEDIGLSRAGAKRRKVRKDVCSTPLYLPKDIADLYKGYDSDSSQEGDSKKPKKKKKKVNEDDDMFGDEEPQQENTKDDDDDLDAWGKLKRKQPKFVNYKAFQGQEFQGEERDIEDEEESVPSTPRASDDEEIIDEEVGLAGSKKHAPKIEKFNLRQEQAEGVFTDDGGYVRMAADPRAHQDNWMEGLTKGQIRRAAEGMERQRQREMEAERREAEEMSIAATDRLALLIRNLKPRETPLEALARLNQGKKKWQPSQKWKKSKMQVDQETVSEEETGKVKEQIENITASADKMLALGNLNVYSTPRERLVMMYQEDTGERFREDPAQQSETGKWEYKWPGTGEVYSDFSSEDMKGWKAGGFFGDGVLCRRAGSQDEWKSSVDISF